MPPRIREAPTRHTRSPAPADLGGHASTWLRTLAVPGRVGDVRYADSTGISPPRWRGPGGSRRARLGRAECRPAYARGAATARTAPGTAANRGAGVDWVRPGERLAPRRC